MSEGIRITSDGALRLLRFDRPEKKNAITGQMYAALADALEAASRDAAADVVVFLGAPEIFTAGNDIGDFLRAATTTGGLSADILRFLKALATCEKPLLAGIDGLAVGVGTTLLLHCDHVIATPRTILRTPFAALGLVPEAASSLLAPRLIGHPRAFELLVMGRDLSAEAARSAGLVNRVVAPENLEPEILAAAHALAALPREAMLASRKLLKGDPAETLARIDAEAKIFAERLKSREAQQSFAAFMQRGMP